MFSQTSFTVSETVHGKEESCVRGVREGGQAPQGVHHRAGDETVIGNGSMIFFFYYTQSSVVFGRTPTEMQLWMNGYFACILFSSPNITLIPSLVYISASIESSTQRMTD